MATATVVAVLAAPPAPVMVGDTEYLGAVAATVGPEPLELLLHCRQGSAAATAYASKTAGQHLIASGDLSLDTEGNVPILMARVLCDAAPEQFLNEVCIVGRIAGEAKQTSSGKSAARTLAVNRYTGQQEHTDWFRLRGYGYTMERLIKTPKGALVEVTGALERRTSKSGAAYVEVKARTIRVHGKSKKGTEAGGIDPASGTTAAGYDHSEFLGEPNDDMPSDWS